jgi:hypothetical protein
LPAATRTIHPLPFEHLDPKRFEDLVRQLAYDFRPWRQLEPTGRAGSDDGFDIRGYEITDIAAAVELADQDEDTIPPPPMDRLWLIQCKREKPSARPSLSNIWMQYPRDRLRASMA